MCGFAEGALSVWFKIRAKATVIERTENVKAAAERAKIKALEIVVISVSTNSNHKGIYNESEVKARF